MKWCIRAVYTSVLTGEKLHFVSPKIDIFRLALTALHRHHAGRAEHVSREMLIPQELTALFAPWFEVDTALADDEKYVVSGVRSRKQKENEI